MTNCSVCGTGLNRYTLKTLKSLMRIKGGYFTHKCSHCKTTYSPSCWVLLVIIVGLYFVELPSLDMNDGLEIFLALCAIAIVIIVSIAYVLPLTPFTKLKTWSANEN